jgi:putative endopeptidase
MLTLADIPQNEAVQRAKAVVQFEAAIASFTVPLDQLVDPFVTYNKVDLSGLQKLAPNIDWQQFLNGTTYSSITQINIDAPQFYSSLSKFVSYVKNCKIPFTYFDNGYVSAQSVYTWQSYLYWQLINAYATSLSDDFFKENFNFYGIILGGATEMPPRWETCLHQVDVFMGSLLGKYYVQAAFPGDSKNLALQMVNDIEDDIF